MLRNKNVIKAISVLVAIVLWIYVIIEENPTITQKFEALPVQILNEEGLIQRGMTLVGDTNPVVTVTLEGKRAEINKVTRDDIIAVADVFGYSIGENHVPVNVTAPDSVKVIDVRQSKVKLQIDELVSVAKPVIINVVDNGPEDKELGEISVQPSEIMLTGAKSIIENVYRISSTVEKGDFKEEGTVVTSSLLVQDVDGNGIEQIGLSSNTVEVMGHLLTKKEVPLNVPVIGEVDTSYTVTGIDIPETVVIKGPAAEIEAIESVEAEPVDITPVTTATDLPVNVLLPETVMLAAESENLEVHVLVKAVSVVDFNLDYSNIEIVGLKRNQKVSFDESVELVLTAAGAATMVRGAVIDDFKIVIDVTDLEVGTHTVPIMLEYQKAFTGAKVTPSEIQITINGD